MATFPIYSGMGNIGTSGDIRTEINLKDTLARSKRRHNLSSLFQFLKEFHNGFKLSKIPTCVELSTPPNAIKHKFKRVDLGNSILKYYVI